MDEQVKEQADKFHARIIKIYKDDIELMKKIAAKDEEGLEEDYLDYFDSPSFEIVYGIPPYGKPFWHATITNSSRQYRTDQHDEFTFQHDDFFMLCYYVDIAISTQEKLLKEEQRRWQ